MNPADQDKPEWPIMLLPIILLGAFTLVVLIGAAIYAFNA